MNTNRPASGKSNAMKQRALSELKAFSIIALYLWVILGSFTVYRRLILAETGVTYLHYGIALVEALIIAKVILIGSLFGFTRRFDDKPLIVPVAYKSMVFGVLVLLFGVFEHLVDGWIHHQGVWGGLRELRATGAYELAARTLILVVALVPFVAFGEISRELGANRLTDMFFSKRDAPGASTGGVTPGRQ
jgi:hypothetical protein